MVDKNTPNGILVVDKPKGITSHDVVNIARHMFGIRKIGHAGTLDPLATGVLVILVGSATKRSQALIGDDKEYAVRLRLGAATDTGDAFGKVIKTSDLHGITEDAIEEAIMSFRGEIEQVPPMFSAVKFKGKSLYKFARKGITVTRKPRKVRIKNLTIKEVNPPDAVFDIRCSKGTYIRQLCADIGEKLGCGAHMSGLRRVRSGDFHISQAVSVNVLKSLGTNELYNLLITPRGL